MHRKKKKLQISKNLGVSFNLFLVSLGDDVIHASL